MLRETVIVYTAYYSEAVIDLVSEYDLNISIISLSSYAQVLEYCKITPNLLGVIFIEYKTKTSAAKYYREILGVLDGIAESSKLPMCVSVLENTDTVQKIMSTINTKHLDVFLTKYTFFNSDFLRYEGLTTVIANSIGLTKQTAISKINEGDTVSSVTNDKDEFFKAALLISALPDEELSTVENEVVRFPELKKLLYLRTNSDKDTEYYDPTEYSMFNSFAKHCIEKRKEAEVVLQRGY